MRMLPELRAGPILVQLIQMMQGKSCGRKIKDQPGHKFL
jgi:hypothetical protein